MHGISIHERLKNWRYAALRQAKYRAIYAHAVMVAHLDGHLVADDHPSWTRIDAALDAARAGDAEAISIVLREITRLRDN
ncbi:hypothetical protein [Ketogulonicigenium vulgare]|uniref:Uncharacterized protein n=1 Tax=Ketogulonicigenium vulgare (strain WSH-001) TaxID=759362 RepID=F9Y4T3_KETVW|nr:hypothetical protein [Ketogulonicigenium vulgare]ADO43540.1 hypothetical protein EIO_2454 [Ketogulonicigenium vulgare Y25]AEM41817.1 hypothetical protein KVU_1978 [Ketogulonicigenium vulgare WSH-001]ALJ81924.1 hypothetical protein KVH_12565 [Ketogulonicigenium vulgare]ANW35192.1 hypothetical protein KvSKV_12485 [Ketogulonicigenium vulgare]AOZ55575.1 hypothetical protein KVC_2573 [Ketogulonicigenium vulgare]